MKSISAKKVQVSKDFLGASYEIKIFGNYGFVLMMFPTFDSKYPNTVDDEIITSLEDFIKDGLFRVAYVPVINDYFWGKECEYSSEKSNLLYKFNNFLVGEVIRYLYKIIGRPTPIITLGCGKQAGFYSANCFFRRPDLFYGIISIDGVFDMHMLCKNINEEDDNIYFNNPMAFLPNLNDDYWLIHLKAKKDINIIAFSSHPFTVQQANQLSSILESKNIEHRKDIIEGESSIENYLSVIKKLVEEKFA
ncbi:MAG: hypothetical protein ACUVQ1_00365 [Candidatus Kapaibacteriales bacterium]